MISFCGCYPPCCCCFWGARWGLRDIHVSVVEGRDETCLVGEAVWDSFRGGPVLMVCRGAGSGRVVVVGAESYAAEAGSAGVADAHGGCDGGFCAILLFLLAAWLFAGWGVFGGCCWWRGVAGALAVGFALLGGPEYYGCGGLLGRLHGEEAVVGDGRRVRMVRSSRVGGWRMGWFLRLIGRRVVPISIRLVERGGTSFGGTRNRVQDMGTLMATYCTCVTRGKFLHVKEGLLRLPGDSLFCFNLRKAHGSISQPRCLKFGSTWRLHRSRRHRLSSCAEMQARLGNAPQHSSTRDTSSSITRAQMAKRVGGNAKYAPHA